MFLANVPGPDRRVFLVGIEGKRLIPNVTVLRELRRIGIPEKGDVSTDVLNMFPTLPQP
jgi:hypothetical protein